jgi:hypothetical protein
VISSDPNRPRLQLNIKGSVVGVGCQPSKNVYFQAVQGIAAVKEYTIYTVGDDPIEVKILSKPDFIDVHFEKLSGRPPDDNTAVWTQYKLFITLKAETPAGSLRGNLIVGTTSKLSPNLELKVLGQVRPGITADPATIRIWFKDGKFVVNKSCRIKKHTDSLFKIVKIVPSVKELVCRIHEETPGKIYQIEIDWTGSKITALREEKLVVETDDPVSRFIEIPVVLSPQGF